MRRALDAAVRIVILCALVGLVVVGIPYLRTRGTA